MADTGHVGVYINGTPEAALFTILLSDNTCGLFLMPSARDVFWVGIMKYKVGDGKLYFKVQNENPMSIEDLAKDDFDASELKDAKPEGPQQFVEATLVPRKEYIQHGEKGDTKFQVNK